MLHEVATRIRAKTDELAETMTREGGKPRVENADEIGWTAAAFDYYAEMGRNFAGRVIPPIESSQLALVVKEPMGVVACIVPWNYPLLLLSWKLAPALAAGNACVCKPSELTPLSTLALADCFEALPPGVVNLVAGRRRRRRAHRRATRGSTAWRSPARSRPARRSRTCASTAWRASTSSSAARTRSSSAPTSRPRSRSPRAAARGRRTSTRARCARRRSASTSSTRSTTTSSSAFVEHARSLRVGDPLDRPDRPRPDGLRGAAREGRAASSRRRSATAPRSCSAATTPGPTAATTSRPTVVTGAAASTALLSEETFGPVAPIVPVRSLDEAIELANSTRFGLGANVYTRDLKNIFRCMRELKAGTVWINDPLTDNDAGPFGGYKQSGLGRELGQEGLEAFQETKHVHIESELAPKDWWYPYGG